MFSKEASSTIFWVFGMTQPGIEPRSPGPLANTLTARPVMRFLFWHLEAQFFRVHHSCFLSEASWENATFFNLLFFHFFLINPCICNQIFLFQADLSGNPVINSTHHRISIYEWRRMNYLKKNNMRIVG